MPTDYKAELINSLLSFCGFKDKTVISAGAGGSSMVEYAKDIKKVFAVDIDPLALQRLAERLKSTHHENKFELISNDFHKTNLKADAVLFEFSLHEIENSIQALKHAKQQAPNILIMDYKPDSRWAFLIQETEKAFQSWKAAEIFGIKKINRVPHCGVMVPDVTVLCNDR